MFRQRYYKLKNPVFHSVYRAFLCGYIYNYLLYWNKYTYFAPLVERYPACGDRGNGRLALYARIGLPCWSPFFKKQTYKNMGLSEKMKRQLRDMPVKDLVAISILLTKIIGFVTEKSGSWGAERIVFDYIKMLYSYVEDIVNKELEDYE